MVTSAQKEAIVAQFLSTPAGCKKLASAMANPLKSPFWTKELISRTIAAAAAVGRITRVDVGKNIGGISGILDSISVKHDSCVNPGIPNDVLAVRGKTSSEISDESSVLVHVKEPFDEPHPGDWDGCQMCVVSGVMTR
jgi:hypothetical protein